MAVTSVTENGVTYTAGGAMSSEAEIRQTIDAPAKEKPDAPSAAVSDEELDAQPQDLKTDPKAADAKADDRNADGTFKSKAVAKPVKEDKYGGDPRKSLAAKVEYERQRADAAERRAADAEARATAKPVPVASAPVSETHAPAKGSSAYLQLVKDSESDPEWPKLEDYVAAGFQDPYAACNAAQAAFLQDKRLAARDQEAAEQSKHTEARERLHLSNQEGAEKYADWDALMQSAAGQKPLPAAVIQEIFESDSSADLRYHLLTHEDDLNALAGITDPIAAARAIGRLSARLVAVEAPASGPVETPRGSRAKPLIKPVSASPAAPEASPPDAIPFGPRYIQAMNELERKQRGARGA